MAEVRKVFDSPMSGRKETQKLLQLRQDSRSVADYAVDFRTLAAESAWNPESLFNTFLHGISERVKDDLAAWELPMDLNFLIALTIGIAGQLWEHRRERKSVPDHSFLPRLRRIPEVPDAYTSKRIRSYRSSLGNHRGLSTCLFRHPCNWAWLDYPLRNVHAD